MIDRLYPWWPVLTAAGIATTTSLLAALLWRWAGRVTDLTDLTEDHNG